MSIPTSCVKYRLQIKICEQEKNHSYHTDKRQYYICFIQSNSIDNP